LESGLIPDIDAQSVTICLSNGFLATGKAQPVVLCRGRSLRKPNTLCVSNPGRRRLTGRSGDSGADCAQTLRLAFGRRDEFESVGARVDVRDRLFNFWHVTRHAFAPRTTRRMMGVRFDGGVHGDRFVCWGISGHYGISNASD
jgi:hypothetical protein